MKKEVNDIIIYTAEDIQRYVSGGCTPAEMHAIERAALDDPFLAEAIEGFEEMKTTGWEKELAALRKNFERPNEAKVIPLATKKNNWWKVAAAVIVLGTGTILVYNATKKTTPGKEQTQIAKTTVIPADSIKNVDGTTNTATANSTPAAITTTPATA